MNEPTTAVRLVGVYDADGTVLGELAYLVKATVGRSHCSLCDITHGRLRERADWRACRDQLPVPFTTYHRNDQPDTLRAAAGGVAPTVVAETGDGGVVVLLGPAEIARCGASPQLLVDAIERAAADASITWPKADTRTSRIEP